MNYVAVDVGSGLCKFSNSKQKGFFPSLVGKTKTSEDHFSLGLKDHQQILVKKDLWLTGTAAQAFLKEDERVIATKQSWSETDGHIIMIYSVIAYLFPEGFSGSLNIVSGLPMKKYNAEAKSYKNKLIGNHTFSTPNFNYDVTLEESSTVVIPQVVGLHFANMLHNKGNWNETKIAYVDPGTQTTGWAVMDEGIFQNVLSGGDNIGLNKLAKEIRTYLKERYDYETTDNTQILKALRKGSIDIRSNGKKETVCLEEIANQFVPKGYGKLIDKIYEHWSGAKDMDIIVSSGGGRYLISALKRKFSACSLLHAPSKTNKKKTENEEAIFDVVEGYAVYAENMLGES